MHRLARRIAADRRNSRNGMRLGLQWLRALKTPDDKAVERPLALNAS
jgi:hypothetical protein